VFSRTTTYVKKDVETKRSAKYDILISGESHKFDYTFSALVTGMGDQNQLVRSVDVIHNGDYVQFSMPNSSEESQTGEHPYVVTIYPVDKPPRASLNLLDPRTIGINFAPTAALHNEQFQSFDTIVGASRIKGHAPQAVMLHDKERIFVEYETGRLGTHVQMWFAPEMDFALVSMRKDYQSAKLSKPTVETVDSEIHNWGTDSEPNWFPKKVHYQRAVDKNVVIDEHVEFQLVEFRDVQNHEFAIESLNLPGGTPVVDRRDIRAPQRLWNGKKIISDTRVLPQPLLTTKIDQSHHKQQMIRWLLALNLIVIASLLLVFALRKRTQAGKDAME